MQYKKEKPSKASPFILFELFVFLRIFDNYLNVKVFFLRYSVVCCNVYVAEYDSVSVFYVSRKIDLERLIKLGDIYVLLNAV